MSDFWMTATFVVYLALLTLREHWRQDYHQSTRMLTLLIFWPFTAAAATLYFGDWILALIYVCAGGAQMMAMADHLRKANSR
ncbi:MAG: hypothetical protein ABWX96_21350 [Propionibacteriaceae bacterium]